MTAAHDMELCRAVGDSADRLVSTQVFMSGGSAELTTKIITRELYEAARALHGDPLTYRQIEQRRTIVDLLEPGRILGVVPGERHDLGGLQGGEFRVGLDGAAGADR